MKLTTVIILSSLIFSSCDNTADKTLNNQKKVNEIDFVEKVEPTGDTLHVLLLSDDNMKYDKSEIRVELGTIVKLTLKHTGTIPKTAMGHNFVLLKQGVDIVDFGNKAANTNSPDFEIPSDILDNVIAHTKMIGGGESSTIEFLTPPKGSYNFICSFPGHYGMMQGVFIVE